jgi:hypothetical protein
MDANAILSSVQSLLGQQLSAEAAANPAFALVEPSLISLLQQLSQQQPQQQQQQQQPQDGVANMIQGVIRQTLTALTSSDSVDSPMVSEFLSTLPDYNYVAGESLFTDLLMTLAQNITFRDMLQMVLGSSTGIARLQQPLRRFLREKIFRVPEEIVPGRPLIQASLLRLADECFGDFEDLARVVQVRDGVNFAETLHQFFSIRLVEVVEFLFDATPVAFERDAMNVIKSVFSEFVALCRNCFSDDQASLERLLQNRLEIMSGDVSPIVRQWTHSTAVAHLRSYIAGSPTPLDDALLRTYLVTGSEGEERSLARYRRLHPGESQAHEDEIFATPRSSPELMETDVRPPVDTTSAKKETTEETVPLAPIINEEELSFPRSLLSGAGMDPDMVVGTEPWQRVLPSDWVPIVARDAHAGSNAAQQMPFSDAYLSTQPAKRRKVVSESKPEGTVQQELSESLEEAMARGQSAVGAAQVLHLARDVAASPSVQQAALREALLVLNRRLASNSDFSHERFPLSAKKFGSQ